MMRRRQVSSSLMLAALASAGGGLPAVASARPAPDLAGIRARGDLRIGTSGTAPPNTWVDAHDRLQGYDID
jgi:ABC-type amino acid transport substrate-binding protein